MPCLDLDYTIPAHRLALSTVIRLGHGCVSCGGHAPCPHRFHGRVRGSSLRADACSASAMPPTRRRVSRRPPDAVPSAAASSAVADPATVTMLDTTWLEREADRLRNEIHAGGELWCPDTEPLAGGDPADEVSTEEEPSSSEEASSSQYRGPDRAVATPEAGWVWSDPTLCERCSRRHSTRKCSGKCKRSICRGCVRFPEKDDGESRSLFDSRVRCVECHSAAMQGMLHAGPSPIHREFIREQLQMKDPAPAAAPQPAPPMCIAHPPAEPRQTLGAPRRTRSMPPALRRSALLPLPPADPRRPTGRPLPPLPPADPRPLREKTVAEITARLDKVNQRMEEIRAAEADRIAAEADRIAGETDVNPDFADWRPEGHEDAPTCAEGAPEWECGKEDIHFR